MRSVFVLFPSATEAELAEYLQRAYPAQAGPPWVALDNGDPCLYINFYAGLGRDYEPERWADIARRLGGEPTSGLMADVSGRHPGDREVYEFVTGLLTRFDGAAMDEYTTHLWSLGELENGHRVAGHPFFDYGRWYAGDEL